MSHLISLTPVKSNALSDCPLKSDGSKLPPTKRQQATALQGGSAAPYLNTLRHPVS
jgi:hypothetical protein